MSPSRPLGLAGEDAAAEYLENQGLTILDRHYVTRGGEIDIVACEGSAIVFVEVKIRTRVTTPSAADMITPSKQKKLIRTATLYVKQHRLENRELRFDAVLIEAGEISWLKNAFTTDGSYFL